MPTKFSAPFSQVGFRSVVVITLASHARGPGFETQRKQLFYPWKSFFLVSEIVVNGLAVVSNCPIKS